MADELATQDRDEAYAPAMDQAYGSAPAGPYGGEYAEEREAFVPADAQNSLPFEEVQLYGGAESQGQVPVGQQNPIQVRTITVRTGRLVCDIEIADARFRYTTPRLSAFANGQYPDLPHHACVNGVGDTFGYVMEKTSVPHLLEHLTISEQVRAQKSGATTFVGTTEWTNEEAGLACIEVGFKDDLVALRAFNEATRFLNIAVLTCLA